jgi:tetratricopeptide (TPR) repeat protein
MYKKPHFSALLIIVFFLGNYQTLFAQKNIDVNAYQMEEKEVRSLESYLEILRLKSIGNTEKALQELVKYLEINPNNAAANYEAAQLSFNEQKLTPAIAFAEKAVALDEKNIWYKNLLVELYNKNNEPQKAIKIYEKIVKESPNDKESAMQYAFLLVKATEYKKALEVLTLWEKRDDGDEMILGQKHQIYLKLNDFKNAENELKKLIVKSPTDTRYQIALAEFYDANLKKDEAIKAYKNVLLLEPNNPEALLYMSGHYIEENDTLSFAASANRIIKNNQINLDTKIAYLSYGLMNFSKLDTSKKELYVSLAQELALKYPTEAKAHAIYGDFCYLYEKNEQGLAAYKNSLKYKNDIFEVWQNLFSIMLTLKNYKDLADSSEAALEYFPAHAAVHFYNGLANQYLDRYEKAEKSYRKAIRFSGDNTKLEAQLYSSLGEVYHKMKKIKEMDEAFEESLKIEPDNAFTLNNYAYYLSLRKSQLEKAKQMSRKSLDLQGQNGSFLDTYAWICFQLGQYQEAINFQEKALNFEKDDKTTIYEHYGDILFKMGNTAKALEYWQKSKDAGNASKTLIKKIAEKKYIEAAE